MDIPADELTVDNSWDNAGWGVQPTAGATGTDGNVLPRGFGVTSWQQWTRAECQSAAFSSGQTEIVVIEGLTLGTPDPVGPVDPVDPPDPVKPPDPAKPPPGTLSLSGPLTTSDGSIYYFEGVLKRIK